MATNPDTIWAALRDRLEQRATSFRKVVRYSRNDWALESMPVLEIREDGDETAETMPDGSTLPPRWTHRGELAAIIHTAKDDMLSVPPMTQLHNLVHEIRTALERQTNDPQGSGEYRSDAGNHWTNLGGLVESMTVGPVKKGVGSGAGTGMATIAIEFTVF